MKKNLPANLQIIPTVKSVRPPEIVTVLQKLLEQARSGEITGLAGMALDEDGNVTPIDTGTADCYQVAGLLFYQILQLLAPEEE